MFVLQGAPEGHTDVALDEAEEDGSETYIEPELDTNREPNLEINSDAVLNGDANVFARNPPVGTKESAPKSSTKQRDFLVHNSNNYASTKTFANFVFCFPFLFPYGRGGFEEIRTVKMSEKAWFLRCLRVHGGAFQTHYGFAAMGYDSIATSLAYTAQYIAMRFRKSAIQFGVLNKDTVRLCLRYQQQIQSNKRRGLKVNIFINCFCVIK
jgi:hypothetical protein